MYMRDKSRAIEHGDRAVAICSFRRSKITYNTQLDRYMVEAHPLPERECVNAIKS